MKYKQKSRLAKANDIQQISCRSDRQSENCICIDIFDGSDRPYRSITSTTALGAAYWWSPKHGLVTFRIVNRLSGAWLMLYES